MQERRPKLLERLVRRAIADVHELFLRDEITRRPRRSAGRARRGRGARGLAAGRAPHAEQRTGNERDENSRTMHDDSPLWSTYHD